MTKKQIIDIQNAILSWYKMYGRHDLPWRKTTDMYKIAISEIMLQQTNVPKVIEKFSAFITRFPTVEALAAAEQKDVIMMWQGLGYNRRALYVYKMAQGIVDDYDGVFPRDAQTLMTLYGIGPYTSRSILIFACNADSATWDVNIMRIMRRIHGDATLSDAHVEELCKTFLPQGKSRDWHNALMDFASGICTKRAPQCTVCPLKKWCLSYPQPQDAITTKKKEVGRRENGKHIPRRIYRGRIVEFLRHNTMGTIDEIGRAVKKDYCAKNDGEWCRDVLLKLEKEGILTCKHDKWML